MKYLLPLLFLVLLAGAAQAQSDPGSGGPQPEPQQPTAVPLDGGASLLAAGAVSFGLRRLRRRS